MKGFTLVETMLVVGILGILLAIAVPNVLEARDNGQARTCIANLHQIDSSKEMLQMDQKLSEDVQPNMDQLVPEYMQDMPVCPAGGVYTINPFNENPTCSINSPIPHKL